MRTGGSSALVVAAAALLVGSVALAGSQIGQPPAALGAGGGPVQPGVAGNLLVDARSGDAWVPHGVNWPDLEYSCVQGWEPTHPAIEPAHMASWGVDLVRLPLNQDCWLGVDGAPTNGAGTAAYYRGVVAGRVAAAHDAGLAVILDLHWSAPAGELADGQRSMPDAQSTEFWASVAAAYRDDPSVMFELFNEPYSHWGGNAVDWDCWAAGGCSVPVETDREPSVSGATFTAVGMDELVAAVRGAGAEQPILLGGLNYSNDLTGWLAAAPDDDQLVAAWHNYPGQGCWSPCWDTTIVGVAAELPVLMTEFGYVAGDTGQFTETMAWADAHGMGYLPWAWWRVGPADDAAAHLYALVDAAFAPRSPAGVLFHDHLAEAFPGSVGPPPTTTEPPPPPSTTAAAPVPSAPPLATGAPASTGVPGTATPAPSTSGPSGPPAAGAAVGPAVAGPAVAGAPAVRLGG